MFGFGKIIKTLSRAETAPETTAQTGAGTAAQSTADAGKPGGLLARLTGRKPVSDTAPAVTTEVPALGSEPQQPTTTEQPASRLLAAAQSASEAPSGLIGRLKDRLARTRAVLTADIGDLIRGRKVIDPELLEELETLLLTADVGVPTTLRIVEELRARVERHELAQPTALIGALRTALGEILRASAAPVRQPTSGRPQVILTVGVNGVGKTTTIGKLAWRLQQEGNSVMLAAGDTFRAAAVEQLQVWGKRNGVPVIAQGQGADSASVIFDALQAATARGADVLIADTAGRLHTKSNLMEELRKIARVMQKIDPEAPHEVLLTVDATTGQNALHQALEFHKSLQLTGIALTKLDGTAKGGILFALADQLKVPIRFIGVGEGIEDLRYFEPDAFLDALLTP